MIETETKTALRPVLRHIPPSKKLSEGLKQNTYEYEYNGKNYAVNDIQGYNQLPPTVQQSLLTMLSRDAEKDSSSKSSQSKAGNGNGGKLKASKRSKNRASKAGSEGKPTPGSVKNGASKERGKNVTSYDEKGQEVAVQDEADKDEILRSFLNRLTAKKLVSTKLNVVEAFRRSFVEPHKMLLPRIKRTRTIRPVLVIGKNTNYHTQDKDLHSRLIRVAEEMGFDVVTSQNFIGGYQYKEESLGTYGTYVLDLINENVHPFSIDKGRVSVYLFYQGCGTVPQSTASMWNDDVKSRVQHFTCFEANCDCGCNQLKIARKEGVTMHESMNSYGAYENWRPKP